MNKKPNEARQSYEEAVRVAYDMCKESIEKARQQFLTVKRAVRRIRDESIKKARLEYRA